MMFEVLGRLRRWRRSPEWMYVCVEVSLSLCSFWCQIWSHTCHLNSFDFLGASQGPFGPALVSVVVLHRSASLGIEITGILKILAPFSQASLKCSGQK